ncbi:MAG: class I SAM-dependent methyltransferase [Gemmatimonadales bacterium]
MDRASPNSPPKAQRGPAAGDPIGAATLERLAAAPRFNAWMFERLAPWVGSSVIEVGSGIGNLSAFLVDRPRVVLTDTEPHYLDRLRERFAGRANVSVRRLYLPDVDGILHVAPFDTVVCLNVLEHVADDLGSLRAIRRLLTPGAGRLLLLVPALPALYGTLDVALGHHRRYTPRDLRAKFTAAGFRTVQLEYFNLAGIPGWWLTGRVLRHRLIPSASVALFEALVPLFRLERFLPWRIGQSLIAIGEAVP